jgi:hypothetical protein
MTIGASQATSPLPVIQGLWVSGELSPLEQLSIASFLRHGHAYHLYTYGDVRHSPPGTVIRDGREILPESRIFQYREHATVSGFANFFRYKLLLERGGWWVDTDTVCLRPFDFPQAYVFSSELAKGQVVVNCGAIKAPRYSAVMEYAWSVCEQRDPGALVWGEVGPRLMGESVRRLSLDAFVMRPECFCPIGYYEWASVLDAARDWTWGDEVYAVHLWNDMWRRNGRSKTDAYDPDCLYEQLKRRYLPLPTESAAFGRRPG